MLESALARPKNLFAYSTEATLRQLAAAYAIALAKNLAFIDGNKRTAWLVCALFLELNHIRVIADQAEVVRVLLGAADSTISEEMVSWLEQENVTAR